MITALEIRDGDVIRLTPGGPPRRVFRDPKVEPAGTDATTTVHVVTTNAGEHTLPADAKVETVARHGRRRTVSLTKAWYLGPVDVGAVVVYKHTDPSAGGAPVFRVVDISHGPTSYYHLAPFHGGEVVHTDAQVGDLTLVRSRVLDAIRATKSRRSPAPTAAQQELFEEGDA